MAESTLTLQYEDFMRRVADYLGYGFFASQSEGLTAEQETEVDDLVQSGYRMVLIPPPVIQVQHEWSWLWTRATLDLVAGTGGYDLPDDFAHLDGPMTYPDDQDAFALRGLKYVSDARMREFNQMENDNTDQPHYVSVRPGVNTPSGSESTRWVANFWPIPDKAYTISYRYRRQLDKLTTSAPFPPGGPQMSEVYLAAMLAAAEDRSNDERGPKWQRYQEQLLAAIGYDVEQGPENLGSNLDHSRGQHLPTRAQTYVRYNGTLYDGT